MVLKATPQIEIDDKAIGYHIRKARKRLHLTQAKAAELIGVSTGYYARIERGETRPNLERLILICVKLQTGVADILNCCCVEMMTLPHYENTDPRRECLHALISKASHRTIDVMLAVCEPLYSKIERKI